MNLRHLTAATSAALLAVTPLAASAAPIERASAPATEASEIAGSDIGRALIIILIAAAGMGFLLLTDDEPDSP